MADLIAPDSSLPHSEELTDAYDQPREKTQALMARAAHSR